MTAAALRQHGESCGEAGASLPTLPGRGAVTTACCSARSAIVRSGGAVVLGSVSLNGCPHMLGSEHLFGEVAIVLSAQQPKVIGCVRAAQCPGDFVMNLQEAARSATPTVCRHEGASEVVANRDGARYFTWDTVAR